ncbi:MAG: peptidyl-prolyl cis-trans isomerase [Deltaproteobacteria bacterium]|nr:peptidyl-prolyl cis-trans isomerase [Deltaproteobacteria bacterium]
MIYRLLVFFLLLSQPLFAQAADAPALAPAPAAPAASAGKGRIVMETTMGTIKIELFDDKAPITCKNFRRYVFEGFFNGLIFHRVIPGFVIQGGGFEPGMKQKPTHEPIVNEADNGLKNTRGTLSMARTQDIYSATSQFFINVVDNKSLDHRGKTPAGFGYAVFAKVVEGMEVADKIVATPTGQKGFYQDVPKTDMVMLKVYEEK